MAIDPKDVVWDETPAEGISDNILDINADNVLWDGEEPKRGSFKELGLRALDEAAIPYYGAVRGAGNLIGSDWLEQAGKEGVERNIREAEESLASERLQKWEDANDLPSLGRFLYEQGIINSPAIALDVGATVVGSAFPGGAFLLPAAVSFPSYYGGNINRQVATSGDIESQLGAISAAVGQSAIEGATPLVPVKPFLRGATEVAEAAAKPGLLARKAAINNAFERSALTRVPYNLVKRGAMEGSEEVAQSALERLQAGLPVTGDDAMTEFKQSFVVGAGLGGLIGGVSSTLGPNIDMRDPEIQRQLAALRQNVDDEDVRSTIAALYESGNEAEARNIEGAILQLRDLTGTTGENIGAAAPDLPGGPPSAPVLRGSTEGARVRAPRGDAAVSFVNSNINSFPKARAIAESTLSPEKKAAAISRYAKSKGFTKDWNAIQPKRTRPNKAIISGGPEDVSTIAPEIFGAQSPLDDMGTRQIIDWAKQNADRLPGLREIVDARIPNTQKFQIIERYVNILRQQQLDRQNKGLTGTLIADEGGVGIGTPQKINKIVSERERRLAEATQPSQSAQQTFIEAEKFRPKAAEPTGAQATAQAAQQAREAQNVPFAQRAQLFNVLRAAVESLPHGEAPAIPMVQEVLGNVSRKDAVKALNSLSGATGPLRKVKGSYVRFRPEAATPLTQPGPEVTRGFAPEPDQFVTPLGRQVLDAADKGGIPAFMSNGLRQAAQENGIDIAPTDNPASVVQKLREKAARAEARPPVEGEAGPEAVNLPLRKPGRPRKNGQFAKPEAPTMPGPKNVRRPGGEASGLGVEPGAGEAQVSTEPRPVRLQATPEGIKAEKDRRAEEAARAAEPEEAKAARETRINEARAKIKQIIEGMKQRGPAGRVAARAFEEVLKDARFGEVEAYHAYLMSDIISKMFAGTKARPNISFVKGLVGARFDEEGNFVPGQNAAMRFAPTPGMNGLIELSLSPRAFSYARENAAHEAFHALQDMINEYDPQASRLLFGKRVGTNEEGRGIYEGGAFKDGMTLADLHPSVANFLKRHAPDEGGKSYYDRLSDQFNAMAAKGRTDFMSQREMMAYVFGALSDARMRGISLEGTLPLYKRIANAIAEFRQRMGNFLRGEGYVSTRDVLDDYAYGRRQKGYGAEPVMQRGRGEARGEASGLLDEAGPEEGQPIKSAFLPEGKNVKKYLNDRGYFSPIKEIIYKREIEKQIPGDDKKNHAAIIAAAEKEVGRSPVIVQPEDKYYTVNVAKKYKPPALKRPKIFDSHNDVYNFIAENNWKKVFTEDVNTFNINEWARDLAIKKSIDGNDYYINKLYEGADPTSVFPVDSIIAHHYGTNDILVLDDEGGSTYHVQVGSPSNKPFDEADKLSSGELFDVYAPDGVVALNGPMLFSRRIDNDGAIRIVATEAGLMTGAAAISDDGGKSWNIKKDGEVVASFEANERQVFNYLQHEVSPFYIKGKDNKIHLYIHDKDQYPDKHAPFPDYVEGSSLFDIVQAEETSPGVYSATVYDYDGTKLPISFTVAKPTYADGTPMIGENWIVSADIDGQNWVMGSIDGKTPKSALENDLVYTAVNPFVYKMPDGKILQDQQGELIDMDPQLLAEIKNVSQLVDVTDLGEWVPEPEQTPPSSANYPLPDMLNEDGKLDEPSYFTANPQDMTFIGKLLDTGWKPKESYALSEYEAKRKKATYGSIQNALKNEHGTQDIAILKNADGTLFVYVGGKGGGNLNSDILDALNRGEDYVISTPDDQLSEWPQVRISKEGDAFVAEPINALGEVVQARKLSMIESDTGYWFIGGYHNDSQPVTPYGFKSTSDAKAVNFLAHVANPAYRLEGTENATFNLKGTKLSPALLPKGSYPAAISRISKSIKEIRPYWKTKFSDVANDGTKFLAVAQKDNGKYAETPFLAEEYEPDTWAIYSIKDSATGGQERVLEDSSFKGNRKQAEKYLDEQFVNPRFYKQPGGNYFKLGPDNKLIYITASEFDEIMEKVNPPAKESEPVLNRTELSYDGRRISAPIARSETPPPISEKFLRDKFGDDPARAREMVKWFGRSKIIDSEGNPIIFYRGTNSVPSKTMRGQMIFSSPAPQFANIFAKSGQYSRVQPVYVRAENPFDYDNPQHIKMVDDAIRTRKGTSGFAGDMEFQKDSPSNWSTIEDKWKYIRDLGFDSAFIRENNVKNIYVLDANQYKSAFNAFDPGAAVSPEFSGLLSPEGEELPVRKVNKSAAQLDNDIEAAAKRLQKIQGAGTRKLLSLEKITRPIFEKMTRFTDPKGGMTAKDVYRMRLYKALGDIRLVEKKAKELYDRLDKATPEQRKLMFDYLKTKGAAVPSLPPELRKAVMEAKQDIIDIGRQLVAKGLLKEETVESKEGGYLPRLYLKFVLENPTFGTGSMRRSGRRWDMKLNEDLDEEIRKAYGEIKDPAFATMVAQVFPRRDMIVFDFLKGIAEATGTDWVLPKSVVDWRGLKVTPYWLASEAAGIRERMKTEPDEKIRKEMGDMASAMQDIADHYGLEGDIPKNYRQLPNSPRYGLLRGMVVRREIYDDLVGMGTYSGDMDAFQKIFGDQHSAIAKGVQYWKLSKTVYNLPAHVRQFFSNGVLLHLSGVPLPLVPTRVVQAIDSYLKNDKYWQIAEQYGVTSTGMVDQELRGALEQIRAGVDKMGNGPLNLPGLRKAMEGLALGPAKLYQLNDTIFKVAKIIDVMKAQEKKLGPLSASDAQLRAEREGAAALEAHKWFMDYADVHSWVKSARNAPLGMPFITYQYKIAPLLAEVMLKQPWRFLPYVGLYFALPAVAAAGLGMSEDEVEKAKRMAKEFIKNNPGALPLPVKDANDNFQFVDVSYLFPWSYFSGISNTLANAAQGKASVSDLLKSASVFSSPVLTTPTALMTNTDTFTGEKITNEFDTPDQKFSAWLGYVWGQIAPPILTNYGAIGKPLGDWMYGNGQMVDRKGNPKETTAQLFARGLGFNVYPVDPVVQRAQVMSRMNYEINQTKSRMTYALRDKRLTKEQRDEVRRDYLEEIRRRVKEMQDYARDTYPTPAMRKQ